MLTLYHAPTSVCSQKVRIGFALIGLDYESRLVNLAAGEQFEPGYLALNPDAVVPTLVDDGLVVVESSLILEHLDAQHNAGRLMPGDPAERLQAKHWLLRCLQIHAAINTLSFATAYRLPILASKTPAEIDALAARFPDPVMGAKRRDLILNGTGSAYVAQALIYLRRMLDDLQAQLAGDWLGGQGPAIADVALVAYVDRLDRLGLHGLWDAHPAVGPWLARWQALPAYAAGIEAFTPPGSAAPMRAAGLTEHWPVLQEHWAALRKTGLRAGKPTTTKGRKK